MTHYVAPGGNDAAAGSIGSPWATIQKAADALAPGDTALIRSGTYREQVVITRSGEKGAEIVFAAYPGESPVIDGSTVTLPEGLSGLVHIFRARYIRVRGLRVQYAGPDRESAGFLVEEGRNIVLEGNTTYDTRSSGIGVWGGQEVTLDGNEVILASHGGQQEQISLDGVAGFDVVGNRVHDAGSTEAGGEGIDIKNGSHGGKVRKNQVWNVPEKLGIYVDAWDKRTWDIEVDGNVVHDCAEGIALASEMGGLLESIRVTNNVVWGNGYRGLVVADYGGTTTHPIRNLTIANNTFVGNGTSGWGGGIAADNPEVSGLVLCNNVVSGNTSFQIVLARAVPAGRATIDHNLIDGYRGNVEEGEVKGTDAVEAEPLFVSAQTHDYRLSAGSPAIDMGNQASAPSLDFDGVARPQGDGIDLGAFERTAASSSSILFVPAVLKTAGRGGSFFTTEMTLTNRGAGSATIRFDYTASSGGGSGSGTTTLGSGRQLVIADAIDYLRSRGVPIPLTGSLVGTLRVTFSGIASPVDAAVTVRTTTPVPPLSPTGSAGLSYAGIPLTRLPASPVVLCGLRSDALDRSNVAFQNAGGAGEGDVTLRATLVSGASPGTTLLVDEKTLGPGGFYQLTVPDGFFGYARVERVSGTAPFYAYAVINDNANSDGSFVAPVLESALGGPIGVTLPVVVEASVFSTELIVASLSDQTKRLRLSLHSDSIGVNPVETVLDLAPGAQVSRPEFVQSLRASGQNVPGPVVGPLVVTVDGGVTSGVFVGARTGNPGGGGRYALSYAGVPFRSASSATAWIHGLQQSTTTRSNLAIVNTGEIDATASSFLIEIWDGTSGEKKGEKSVSVAATRQLQVNTVLTDIAPGTTNGYARITKTSGTNPFVAYGVLNDGATTGSRSGDGAYILSD